MFGVKVRRNITGILVVISPKGECPYSLRSVLALFNSKLLNYYYVNFLKSSKKLPTMQKLINLIIPMKEKYAYCIILLNSPVIFSL